MFACPRSSSSQWRQALGFGITLATRDLNHGSGCLGHPCTSVVLVTIGGVWQHPLADQLRMNTPSTNAATKNRATTIPTPQRNFFNFPSPLFLECPYHGVHKDSRHKREAQILER